MILEICQPLFNLYFDDLFDVDDQGAALYGLVMNLTPLRAVSSPLPWYFSNLVWKDAMYCPSGAFFQSVQVPQKP